MTTEEHIEPATGPPVGGSGAPSVDDPPAEDHQRAAPSWWHREHPTFTSLAGFFTGLIVVIVIPGSFGAVLNQFVDDSAAARLFPFVTVIFVIPLGLVAFPRTRRFGGYMLLGMLVTAIVVLGVAALTLWALIANDK